MIQLSLRYPVIPLALLGVALIGQGTGCRSTPRGGDAGTNEVAMARQGHHVLPLDQLRIDVMGEPDISRVYTVSAEGDLIHPLLGEVHVEGLALREVETRLTQRLASDFLVNPRVTVRLEASQGRRAIVLGEVKSPGTYIFPPGEPMTLLRLVSMAGGFSDVAAISRVRIVRRHDGEEENLRVNVKKALKGSGGKDGQVPLEPGDVVTVPERFF